MTGIQEIARATGLSKSMVSRALRGLPSVSESTTRSVQRAADQLGYIPSSVAAGLATGRNRAIGVLVPLINRWFYVKVLEGIDAQLREAGYDLILYNLGGRGGDRERVFHRSILRKRIDALVVLCLVFDPGTRPTAVFAASDAMAFGAFAAIAEEGLSVPGDISVIGIDGHENGDALGLTTISQNPYQQGVDATRVLLAELDGREHAETFEAAPFELVVRRSTAPPRR